MDYRKMAKLVHWTLLVAAVLTLVSGLGITEYQTVGALTFGLLNKASAFKLHLWVWIPFLVLLVLHLLLTARPQWFRRKR
jgi:thiosulfate reductase cytochrome b subunit